VAGCPENNHADPENRLTLKQTGLSSVRHTEAARYGPFGLCEKCAEIEKTIAWYRKIQRSINDQKTIDGAEKLIAELEVKKLALHPERK
jgi:hypothetical protein